MNLCSGSLLPAIFTRTCPQSTERYSFLPEFRRRDFEKFGPFLPELGAEFFSRDPPFLPECEQRF
ncbi:hypothetical protein C8R42DRAFT_655916 [Lentinula raphanica]|nr:hypothetical protein C8R42DRAFT_655916 [Lentinula raphanica]